MTWRTDYATDVTIDQLGKVDPSGSRDGDTDRVDHLSPGGEERFRHAGSHGAHHRDTLLRLRHRSKPPAAPIEQLFSQNMKDVFFDYDSYDISPQYQQVLQADARFLQQHPNMKFTIEGHCDERGSTEYNLALGDNRANAAKQALVQLGISGDRIRTISYGKEKPFCTESTESCWQQNRRAHFVYQK